jgi:hypothetical protein
MLAGISSRSAANDDDSRHFNVEIELYSYNPEQGISSYRWYGRGSSSGLGDSTTGFFADDERQFSVTIESIFRSGQYVASVRVEPKDGDSVSAAKRANCQRRSARRRAALGAIGASVAIGRSEDIRR